MDVNRIDQFILMHGNKFPTESVPMIREQLGLLDDSQFTRIAAYPYKSPTVALIISGYAPLPRVLQLSFGDNIPTLILFAMVLFGAIQHVGVTRYISRWFLTRRIINGKPVMFSFIFIYATYVLAALSANILPALLFMWAIL